MERIYAAIAESSQKFTLPAPWQDVPCDPAFVRLPIDNLPLLARMRARFLDEDLVKAGVVQVDAEQNVRWHPYLVSGNEPIWMIHAKPDAGDITQLMAQMRILGQDKWSVSSAWQDHRQRQLMADGNNSVVVAYSMTDLAILRSVGIAAVPGGSGRHLSKPQLNFLRRMLCIPPQTATSSPRGKALQDQEILSPSLTVANWSLGAMNRTDIPAATSFWAHLVELHRYLNLPFDSFCQWKPEERYFKQLRYQIEYLNVQQLRVSLLENIDHDSTGMDAEIMASRPPAQTIVDAYDVWRRLEGDEMNHVRRAKAYDHLCGLIDRQRFNPLVEEALRATNLLERNAEIALAETSRLLQPQILLLTEKLRRSLGEKGTKLAGGPGKEELDQVLALTDRQIALMQEVQACRRNQSGKAIKPLKPTARSKPSVSGQKRSPR